MRKCSKCRNPGHDKRSCKKERGGPGLRRKNPIVLGEIVTIYIKETPTQREAPLSIRPKCRGCGDLGAALIAKLKNGQSRPLQWADSCLSCLAESLTEKHEHRFNPKGNLPSSEGPRRSHSISSQCKICGIPTKNKDYCVEHIEEAPYASYLSKKMKEVEEEESSVATFGISAIKPTSSVVRDIIKELSLQGEQLASKLARELDLPLKIIEIYIQYMERSGQVRSYRTSRNSLIVILKND
jgi:hypothetical protein